ncbi:hypothetical protein RB195_020932 [Necator americanus]|uniref:Uncharacterized protein n=1 Tax=Necator americanus TaxID=51031 RepID=A0ABR1CLA8_NECAM
MRQDKNSCDSRGVGGLAVLVNTSMAGNINFLEQVTTGIGREEMRRCVPMPVLTIFVAYAPTSSRACTLHKFVDSDFNAKISLRRTSEDFHFGYHGPQRNEEGIFVAKNDLNGNFFLIVVNSTVTLNSSTLSTLSINESTKTQASTIYSTTAEMMFENSTSRKSTLTATESTETSSVTKNESTTSLELTSMSTTLNKTSTPASRSSGSSISTMEGSTSTSPSGVLARNKTSTPATTSSINSTSTMQSSTSTSSSDALPRNKTISTSAILTETSTEPPSDVHDSSPVSTQQLLTSSATTSTHSTDLLNLTDSTLTKEPNSTTHTIPVDVLFKSTTQTSTTTTIPTTTMKSTTSTPTLSTTESVTLLRTSSMSSTSVNTTIAITGQTRLTTLSRKIQSMISSPRQKTIPPKKKGKLNENEGNSWTIIVGVFAVMLFVVAIVVLIMLLIRAKKAAIKEKDKKRRFAKKTTKKYSVKDFMVATDKNKHKKKKSSKTGPPHSSTATQQSDTKSGEDKLPNPLDAKKEAQDEQKILAKIVPLQTKEDIQMKTVKPPSRLSRLSRQPQKFNLTRSQMQQQVKQFNLSIDRLGFNSIKPASRESSLDNKLISLNVNTL